MSYPFNDFIATNDVRIKRFAERIQNFRIAGRKIGYLAARNKTINWLNNFNQLSFRNFELPLYLLEKTEFVTTEHIVDKLFELSSSLLQQPNSHIAPLGEFSESSFRITSVHNQNFNFHISITELLDSLPSGKNINIILYDDFLNSGGQVVTIFKTLLGLPMTEREINDEAEARTQLNESQKSKLLEANIHLFYYKAFDEGIELLEEKNLERLNLKIRIKRYLAANSHDGIFGDKNDQYAIENGLKGEVKTNCIFMNYEYIELTDFYLLLKAVGEALLYEKEPVWELDKRRSRALGYGNLCRAIISDYNVPTITLTPIWLGGIITLRNDKVRWEELLPRRKKVLGDKSTNQNVETVNIQVKGRKNKEHVVFHDLVLEKYLKKDVRYDLENLNAGLTSYSNLYFHILQFVKGKDLISYDSANLLDSLITQVISTTNSNPLLINCFPGGGKSALLSILYLNLFKRSRSGVPILPFMINLHYYNKYIYENGNGDFLKQAKAKLDEDFLLLRNEVIANKDKEVIIIIDGADEYISPKVDLDDYLSDKIRDLGIEKKIVGLRRHKEENTVSYKKEKIFKFIDDPEIIIDVKKISSDDPSLSSFVNSFAEIEAKPNKKSASEVDAYLNLKIKQFKIQEVDLFVLSLLSQSITKTYQYDEAQSFSTFLQKYFEYNPIRLNIMYAADISFQMFNKPEGISNKEKNTAEWWIIQKHDVIRDFLVAYYVIEKLIEYKGTNKNTFSYVYPYDLNNFCKEIINRSSHIQKKAFESIKVLLQSQTGIYKTHLCYLLGRFTDQTIKEKALLLLRDVKISAQQQVKDLKTDSLIRQLSKEEKASLLLLRTIFISLSYLGDKKATEEYIGQLMSNKYFDNLNRGFHLEYYEDITFDRASPENLRHEDNLGEFTQTYSILFKRIKQSLVDKKVGNLFEIELYTLCSLAQHRYISGALEVEKKEAVKNLISQSLNNIGSLSKSILKYLRFMNFIFNEPDFRKGSLINRLYNLKSLQREGWVKRKVANPESVASHMYGAFLLGYIYLPNSIVDVPEYSKDKILKMLLIHDLGEAFVGDLLPDEKNKESDHKEWQHVEYISLMGMFEGFSGLGELLPLFEDFNSRNDINSKIASDIDKLENLLQLMRYGHLEPIQLLEDFVDFKRDLISRISTDEGRRIMQEILDFFEER